MIICLTLMRLGGPGRGHKTYGARLDITIEEMGAVSKSPATTDWQPASNCDRLKL